MHIEQGTAVWFTDSYDNLQSGIVISAPWKHRDQEYVTIRLDSYGTCNQPVNRLYPTQESCMEAYRNELLQNTAHYKDEMPDIPSIIAFCLKHVVAPAEEYTNNAARQAVLERAAELGLKIQE